MRREIIIGTGILIILLALAGTGSAKGSGYGSLCTTCHISMVAPITPDKLTAVGNFFNTTHRYNDSSITPPTCAICHSDVNTNFNLSTNTPTYTNSTTCKQCHKTKYDDWYNTLHRVMLTSNTSGAAMNLTVPNGLNWSTTNVTYMIVGKKYFYYLNETGKFFAQYYVENQTFAPKTIGNYSCGSCHTTGYNASGSQNNLSGIIGTWVEEGITCENCHGPGGNGHQVTINKTGGDCKKCHDGLSRQGQAFTNKHATAPAEESTNPSCTQCHSPYDRYIGGKAASLETASNVSCFVCHDPHSVSDDAYGTLLSVGGFNNTSYADVKDTKLSFFNGTASNVSRFNNGSTFTGTNKSLVDGNDLFDLLQLPWTLYPGYSVKSYGTTLKDSSYDNTTITVTRNISEVLCSKCHYRHGLEHIKSVNMTHGRNNANVSEWATCIDCHMSKAGGKSDHSFDAENVTNYPRYTCSKGSNCHVTSTENQNLSNDSIVPYQNEWKVSKHNELSVGNFYVNSTNFDSSGSNNSSCNKCHSPRNWNPANDSATVKSEDFKGITCGICHNIHDMGDSFNKSGKNYSWFKRNGVYASGRWGSVYSSVANATELCGNCHASVGLGREGPGWNGSSGNPTSPHGWPAKDVFIGSVKESGLMNFTCIDCHMYVNKTYSNGTLLPDASKASGHRFNVSATSLQNTSACSSCHVNGTSVDTIPNVIAKIQSDTLAKQATVNASVNAALAAYKAYGGVKSVSADKIAQAYWNVNLVASEGSWGVHDPVGTMTLLDNAKTLADASNASLGLATSNVDLLVGWNLVSLNGTPSVTAPVSVMASVLSNITVVWTYNSTSADWELYDPAMPTALNDLKSMVPGKGYWIYATQNSKWTV